MRYLNLRLNSSSFEWDYLWTYWVSYSALRSRLNSWDGVVVHTVYGPLQTMPGVEHSSRPTQHNMDYTNVRTKFQPRLQPVDPGEGHQPKRQISGDLTEFRPINSPHLLRTANSSVTLPWSMGSSDSISCVSRLMDLLSVVWLELLVLSLKVLPK